jgi:hypothetical protein
MPPLQDRLVTLGSGIFQFSGDSISRSFWIGAAPGMLAQQVRNAIALLSQHRQVAFGIFSSSGSWSDDRAIVDRRLDFTQRVRRHAFLRSAVRRRSTGKMVNRPFDLLKIKQRLNVLLDRC